MDLPTGTVTFLFTDIEGSTRLWENHPEEMRRALARHDALMGQAIERHSGVVFKTVGDGVCAAFRSAASAAAAALDAQRSLLTPGNGAASGFGPLRVRMALHTGIAEPDDGDYVGPPLNRVARLMGVAHGGQVLLSEAAAQQVQGSLPDGASLRELGRHRLADLMQPELVYQLLHADLSADFPPLRSVDAHPNNLPVQLTSFIGRQAALESLRALLPGTRLLTLTGAGGCGKTRLALQVAAESLDRYPGGVWFVDLAPLREPALVTQAVAGALRVVEAPGRDLLGSITEYLKAGCLLILDNCEHLLDSCARLAHVLLTEAANLTIVATSREPLGISGERAWPVPTLSLPNPVALDWSQNEVVAEICETESARMFAERARLRRPDFAITPRNATAVVRICRQLDGIPLALELAAARTNALSVEQIADRLSNRGLLVDRARDRLPRQQTLQAAMDWSYDLLGEPERMLLRRLSVFAGGWTLEAAERVCGEDGDPIDTPLACENVLDLLSQLQTKSLVVALLGAESNTGSDRYRMLEPVRLYARDALERAGEADGAAARHCDCFLALAEAAEGQLTGPDQAAWLDRLGAEHENLRAALACSSTPLARLRLASALHRFWYVRGFLTEGRNRLEEALAGAQEAPDPARAKAHNGAGIVAWAQGDYAAARAHFEQSLLLFRSMGERARAAATLSNLGMVAGSQGDYPAAAAYYEDSLHIYREQGDDLRAAMVLSNISVNAIDQHDYPQARRVLEESLAIRRRLGDQAGIAIALNNLGELACRLGDHASARSLLHESLDLRCRLGDRRGAAVTLWCLAVVAAREQDHAHAALLFGASNELRASVGAVMPASQQQTNENVIAEVRAALGDEAYQARWREGASLSLDQAAAQAMITRVAAARQEDSGDRPGV